MTIDFEMIKAAFRLRAEYYDLQPRYNIAPGQDVPVITSTPHGREISPMRWGLIPPWAGDAKIGYRMINARAETVGEKPAFKSAFQRRRCLIPATGFYEWKKESRTKQPMLITLPEEKIFALAGIWEQWSAPDGAAVVHSCSIITTEANRHLADIHNRMPVIFTEEEEFEPWLSLNDPSYLNQLLRPYDGDMSIYPVSTKVNSTREDDPGLIRVL